MQDLNDKVTGNRLTANEWNEVPSEIQNVIEGLGITLSSGDLNQLGKAIAGYVSNGTFYTDAGVADAYVLSVIGSKQAATAYTNGFEISFITANANTGAATVDVVGLGVKSLKTIGGGAVPAGYIVAGETINARYDGTDFILSNPISNLIIPFDTISDAIASTIILPGQLIRTSDYRSTSRGGGSLYLVKTAAQASADGDVFSASTTGNILLDSGDVAVIQDDILDVRIYGAVGDNVANDTLQFQEAEAKGKPFLSAGTYLLDDVYDVWASAFTSEEAGLVQINKDSMIYNVSNAIAGRYCWATDVDNLFLFLFNREDGVIVMNLARGVAADAATFADSLQTRKDGHTVLSTAGTATGETDIDWRTFNSSDYALIQGVSTYQDETLRLLMDLKPSRNDGTKKDGTGGGGLSVGDDVYSFDAVLSYRSNVTPDITVPTTCLTFGVSPAIANQGLAVRQRSGSNTTYVFEHLGADDAKIRCVETDNILIELNDDRAEIGGIDHPTVDIDYSLESVCKSTQQGYSYVNTVSSLSSGSTTTIKMVDAGIARIIDITINVRSTGGVGWYYKISVHVDDAGTITNIAAAATNFPVEVIPTIFKDGDGDIALSVEYTGGFGGAVRVIERFDIT